MVVWKEGTSVFDRFVITKKEHYNRNQNNADIFPNPRKNDLSMSLSGFYWDSNAYFHKIGEYDGDTSNANNAKHTYNLSNGYKMEAVYNGTSKDAKIVTSPTVMGTYNFGAWNDSDAHKTKDVIPYLIWGNLATDNTNLKERFYYDYDNYKNNKNYTKRGNSLYSAVNLDICLSTTKDTNNYQNISKANLEELLNRYQYPVVNLSLFY